MFHPSDIDLLIRQDWGDIVFETSDCNPTFFLSGTNQSIRINCKTTSKEQILEVKANLSELGGGEFKLNPDYTRSVWSSLTFVAPGSMGIKNIYLIALNSKGMVKTNMLSVTVSSNEQIIYVSQAGDDQNIGTLKGAPVKSFAAALNLNKKSGIPVIYIAGGNYGDVYSTLYVNMRLEDLTNVSFYGGWNSDFTVRDTAAYPTVIDKGNNPNTGIAVIGCQNILLDGITVRGYDFPSDIIDLFYTRGGGILVLGSVATLRNVNIIGCKAKNGGGMLISQSTVFMTNIQFISNSADFGGSLSVFQSDPQISGCMFNNSLEGGGVFITNSSNPYFTNCSFSNNYNSTFGGAIHYIGSFVNLYGNMFYYNNSPKSGGAVFLNNCSNAVLYGNTFAYNTAYLNGSFGGGAVGMKNCPYLVEFHYNTFNANTAGYGKGGGAIIATNCGNLVIQDNQFNYNQGYMSADFFGCAVYFIRCSYQVVRNEFINNGAGSYNAIGGAFAAKFSKGYIVNNLFDGNYAYNLGGALYLGSSSNTIASNQIKNNHVFYDGGGLYCYQSFIKMNDNVWMSNYSQTGGAIECSSSITTNIQDKFIGCWSSGSFNSIIKLDGAWDWVRGYTFISNLFVLNPGYGTTKAAIYESPGFGQTNTFVANVFAINTMDYLLLDAGGRYITNNSDWVNINNPILLKNKPNSTNNRVTNW